MKSQACLLATISVCLSLGATAISCKKRTHNENSQGASSLTGNSPHFLAESIYNTRRIVKKFDDDFRTHPDAESLGKILVHYNSPDEREKRQNGYIYEPGLLDAKLDRLKRTATTQGSPTESASAQEKAVEALTLVRDNMEKQIGRYIVRGESKEESLGLCTNFSVAESMGQEVGDKTLTRSLAVREVLAQTKPYLESLSQATLQGGVRFNRVRESFADRTVNLPYVAWLDTVLEFSLVQGPRNILGVARISPKTLEAWRESFRRDVADPASAGFGKLPAVVFPDGRIAVGAPRVRGASASGNDALAASPSHVLSAACSSLVTAEGGSCKPLSEQPILAAFEITRDPQTGVITNIRDVYFGEAKGTKQYWVQNWSAALEASLLAHGLALHNELRVPFPENPQPIECNVGSK